MRTKFIFISLIAVVLVLTGCVSEKPTQKTKKFVKNRKEIQSIEIRKKIENELKKKDKELSFFYEHHLPNLKKL